MVMTNKETLKIRLSEAEEAYHKLICGEKEVSVSVGNFGSTTYNQTSKKDLEAYISSLKHQLMQLEGKNGRRILKVSF